jgi:hypothetical protein
MVFFVSPSGRQFQASAEYPIGPIEANPKTPQISKLKISPEKDTIKKY